MDLGATDASGHSAKLKKLIAKGLVQRERRNSICNVFLQSSRGSYLYSITEAGIEAAKAL
jgi:predicted transcriptional regulator